MLIIQKRCESELQTQMLLKCWLRSLVYLQFELEVSRWSSDGRGLPHSLIAIPSGCSQVRGPDWGWEGGGGAVMVGRRDQGGMTIWWSSSKHTHTPLSKSLSYTLCHTSTCSYLWLWYGLLLCWLIPSVLELQLWGFCIDMESRASGSL